MEVTALGHAGLRVVGNDSVGLIDPWLSRRGAFLGSWYPLPASDHLATSAVLTPDWVVVTADREDRIDLATLEQLPARTPVFIPTYPSKRLVDLVRTRTHLEVIEVRAWMRVPLDRSGGWLTLVPAPSPAHPSAAVLVAVDGMTLLDCNDARITTAQARQARSTLGGHVDLATVAVADPAWFPFCYEDSPAHQVALAQALQSARLQAVRALLREIEPALVVPFGGPPCFLDPAVARHNRWLTTGVLPVASEVQRWFREHSPDLTVSTLLPGDRCDPRGQLVVPDLRWENFGTRPLAALLQEYALERAVELSRLYATNPEPDHTLGERFAEHFGRRFGLSRYFLERIDAVVRFEVMGAWGGRWDVHFNERTPHVDLRGRAVDIPHRVVVDSRWIEAVVAGAATWHDLLRSLRCSIACSPGVRDDHLMWLLRHDDRDTLLSIEAYERSHTLVAERSRRGESA